MLQVRRVPSLGSFPGTPAQTFVQSWGNIGVQPHLDVPFLCPALGLLGRSTIPFVLPGPRPGGWEEGRLGYWQFLLISPCAPAYQEVGAGWPSSRDSRLAREAADQAGRGVKWHGTLRGCHTYGPLQEHSWGSWGWGPFSARSIQEGLKPEAQAWGWALG